MAADVAADEVAKLLSTMSSSGGMGQASAIDELGRQLKQQLAALDEQQQSLQVLQQRGVLPSSFGEMEDWRDDPEDIGPPIRAPVELVHQVVRSGPGGRIVVLHPEEEPVEADDDGSDPVPWFHLSGEPSCCGELEDNQEGMLYGVVRGARASDATLKLLAQGDSNARAEVAHYFAMDVSEKLPGDWPQVTVHNMAVEGGRVTYEYNAKAQQAADVVSAASQPSSVGGLHLAASEGDDVEVRRLLARGVPAGAADSQSGRTPLHCASTVAVAQTLLQGGGTLGALDREGNSTVHTAIQQGRSPALLEFLMTQRAAAVALDASQGRRAQAALGPEVGNRAGDTALHCASAAGAAATAAVLRHGAPNVHATNAMGDTPLHYARDGETVRLLAEAGADVGTRWVQCLRTQFACLSHTGTLRCRAGRTVHGAPHSSHSAAVSDT